jgi:hypothetical protein
MPLPISSEERVMNKTSSLSVHGPALQPWDALPQQIKPIILKELGTGTRALACVNKSLNALCRSYTSGQELPADLMAASQSIAAGQKITIHQFTALCDKYQPAFDIFDGHQALAALRELASLLAHLPAEDRLQGFKAFSACLRQLYPKSDWSKLLDWSNAGKSIGQKEVYLALLVSEYHTTPDFVADFAPGVTGANGLLKDTPASRATAIFIRHMQHVSGIEDATLRACIVRDISLNLMSPWSMEMATGICALAKKDPQPESVLVPYMTKLAYEACTKSFWDFNENQEDATQEVLVQEVAMTLMQSMSAVKGIEELGQCLWALSCMLILTQGESLPGKLFNEVMKRARDAMAAGDFSALKAVTQLLAYRGHAPMSSMDSSLDEPTRAYLDWHLNWHGWPDDTALKQMFWHCLERRQTEHMRIAWEVFAKLPKTVQDNLLPELCRMAALARPGVTDLIAIDMRPDFIDPLLKYIEMNRPPLQGSSAFEVFQIACAYVPADKCRNVMTILFECAPDMAEYVANILLSPEIFTLHVSQGLLAMCRKIAREVGWTRAGPLLEAAATTCVPVIQAASDQTGLELYSDLLDLWSEAPVQVQEAVSKSLISAANSSAQNVKLFRYIQRCRKLPEDSQKKVLARLALTVHSAYGSPSKMNSAEALYLLRKIFAETKDTGLTASALYLELRGLDRGRVFPEDLLSTNSIPPEKLPDLLRTMAVETLPRLTFAGDLFSKILIQLFRLEKEQRKLVLKELATEFNLYSMGNERETKAKRKQLLDAAASISPQFRKEVKGAIK